MDWITDTWNHIVWLIAPLILLYHVTFTYPVSQMGGKYHSGELKSKMLGDWPQSMGLALHRSPFKDPASCF